MERVRFKLNIYKHNLKLKKLNQHFFLILWFKIQRVPTTRHAFLESKSNHR